MKNAIELIQSHYDTCFKNVMYWRRYKKWDTAFIYLGYAKELKKAISILSKAQIEIEEQQQLTRRQKMFSKKKNFWF